MNKRLILIGSAIMAGTALNAGPARSQAEDYEQIVITMRACSQIADLAARVNCYDNTIRQDGVPDGPVAAPRTGTALPAVGGLGAEQVERDLARAQGDSRENLIARVTGVERLQPGIYLMTLDSGAQWQFVEAAPMTYDPPQIGSSIRIEPAALGSYMMRYDGQRSLRVRRVR
ncbi:hypothetical protein M3P36_13225 [Altererythrobacter sp. KTW20L]|uniref:hypothetical protein n=1 Tax=Altererythrobacter sp. KTW20L TaxID=2942210 RepID=UPI0020BE1061|nr:hypothetical protein [Altererythrobacter sp. KTW20L]MCL6252002.1 hypothetical protein [Altererythrobacter sp. KTW20L]